MSESLRVKLAENVKKFRIEKGFTREQLSILAGLNNSYISILERKCHNITIRKVALIAKALGVSIYDLLS